MAAVEEGRSIPVSPRHHVVLAPELCILIDQAPRTDFVVRTLARREVNDLPLMTAELVIASVATRAAFAAARSYPLHFRKTYFPGRLHGDPKVEFDHHMLAYQLCSIPPPIGYGDNEFRSCLIPGQPYARLTPFGGDPPENNIAKAENQPLATMAGLWRLAEEMLAQLLAIHDAGLAHGDAELHNCIISPSPLEPILIDFESAVRRESLSDRDWKRRCELDLEPILREAVYLQCALGRQSGRLGELAWSHLDRLFKAPDRFRRAIESRAQV
jgi:hypothetical protein